VLFTFYIQYVLKLKKKFGAKSLDTDQRNVWTPGHILISPVTGLEWPRAFQEAKIS